MSEEKPTCVFIRKRKKAATRTKEGCLVECLSFLDSSSSDDDVKIVKKKEKVDSNPLVQRTAYFAAKRKAGSDEEVDEDIANVTFKANYNAVGARFFP